MAVYKFNFQRPVPVLYTMLCVFQIIEQKFESSVILTTCIVQIHYCNNFTKVSYSYKATIIIIINQIPVLLSVFFNNIVFMFLLNWY